MPPRSRPGFFSLIALFLRRMPTVWLGGVGTAVTLLLLLADFGWRAALVGALAGVLLTLGVEFAIDRRRGIGRRLLLRGATPSLRRVAALVVALVVIGSASAAIFSRFLSSANQKAVEDARARTAPGKKRGAR